MNGKARLLKVVFPASFFASLTLKRAPHLRFFSEKGIFIRPSLTKSERDRLRTVRVSRSNDLHHSGDLDPSQQVQSDCVNNSCVSMSSHDSCPPGPESSQKVFTSTLLSGNV